VFAGPPHHAAGLRGLLTAEGGAEAAGALVDALMAGDPSESSELSERERAMVRFATKLTQTPSEMREDTTARQPHLRCPPVTPSATAL